MPDLGDIDPGGVDFQEGGRAGLELVIAGQLSAERVRRDWADVDVPRAIGEGRGKIGEAEILRKRDRGDAQFAGDVLAVVVTAGIRADLDALQVGLGRARRIADRQAAVGNPGRFKNYLHGRGLAALRILRARRRGVRRGGGGKGRGDLGRGLLRQDDLRFHQRHGIELQVAAEQREERVGAVHALHLRDDGALGRRDLDREAVQFHPAPDAEIDLLDFHRAAGGLARLPLHLVTKSVGVDERVEPHRAGPQREQHEDNENGRHDIEPTKRAHGGEPNPERWPEPSGNFLHLRF
jgi:hypothetical protein